MYGRKDARDKTYMILPAEHLLTIKKYTRNTEKPILLTGQSNLTPPIILATNLNISYPSLL